MPRHLRCALLMVGMLSPSGYADEPPGPEVPKDIAVPPSGTFINDLDGLFFQGLSPAGPPPTGFSNTQNRVESVSFPEKGMYLVICNVRTHFLNGMFAFVKVDD